MHALLALTLANIRSYTRDRAAVFWTLAFPLVFIVLFGLIFQGSGTTRPDARLGRRGPVRGRGQAARPGSRRWRASTLVETTRDGALDDDAGRQGRRGHRRAGRATARRSRPRAAGCRRRRPRSRSTPTRRARSSRARSTRRSGRVLGVVNLGGRPPLVVPSPQTVQTENLNAISYFVPSMLGLSIMQVGIFAAIPLVADREKLILKRLAATPLRRWQLVGSNVLMRVLIALHPGGHHRRRRRRSSSASRSSAACSWWPRFVTLGAMAFLALGYVIASFAKTEDAANGMTSMIQFPMMFLSGAFFQIDQMPQFLQVVARLIPLTYLADALRQVMVGGAAFAPLWVCAAVLLGWLVVCFGIAARKFQWQ